MRVTKLIREYVEDSVHKKFQPKRDELWVEYNAKIQTVSDAIDEVVNEANEKAIAIAREAGIEPESNRYSHSDKINLVFRSGYIGDREAEQELRNKERELRDRERDTVSSILLRLELGQTDKAELEDVLAAIEV